MPKIILQTLLPARTGLSAWSFHPSLSPCCYLQGAFSSCLVLRGQTKERCSGKTPGLTPAVGHRFPKPALAWFAQAIRDIHKELKQKSVQCDKKIFKIRCTTAELQLHIHMLEKIGHALYFKFSFMALLYSKIVQRSEKDGVFLNCIRAYDV